ncbi:DUF2163 domain-containing protein [Pseudochrobactrum kiredjianiae]|uniref:DUF2163 domain-containing protein n=1 Tax=Pseudochrobactrum kiredjianiae TaxID=386305 RepID=A0ABW3V8M2_9HYPH|nr:DUF2163 domain-containing protein [Pseudochrobactrum kiredjianiae]MDM7850491.1 DUF2163 domain-containing protein [Pseudochrobactrum kiredjianiae]
MLTLDPQFESHLQGDVTTHCFAWILRRKDEEVFGFCDHDKSLPVHGINCFPQSGMNGSEAGSPLGLSVDSSEIEGALTSDALNDEDIERGLYDGATVETYLVNWMQPQQAVLLRSSVIGKITRSGMKFIAELKSSTALLDRVFGRRAKRGCDAEFADRRCGINPADPRYAGEGVVVRVNGPDMIVSGLSVFAPHWFERGEVLWLGGKNQGSRNSVVSHLKQGEAASLILQDLPVYDVQAGDHFRVLAGCDKSFQQCRDRFANQENFRGFPHIPGNDAAYSFAGGEGNFDGGVLVP